MNHTTWIRRAAAGLTTVALLAAGCDATFVDDRPSASPLARDGAPEADIGPTADGGAVMADGGLTRDAAGPADQGGAAGVLRSGPFEGRSGYKSEGTAELVRQAGGKIVLRLSADFSASSVPAPVLLLSTRDAIGGAIDAQAGDLHLGALGSDAGAQQYDVPADKLSDAHAYAWVYCEPFGVEVARAELEP